MSTQYHISCLHERELAKPRETVEDYYPLEVGEVIDLLETARALRDHVGIHPDAPQEIASIQVRLGQAIPGMECPRAINGPVARKLNTLDSAFVAWIQDPMTLFLKEQNITEADEVVVTLTGLMKHSSASL